MKPLNIPPDITVVSHETLDRLHHYHSLLLKWQEKINLISPNTVPEAWERHFIDSAQLSPLISENVKTLYDLGSGAGFAGLVIAMLRPDIQVTLVESDAKKCAFLSTVSRETGVRVTIRNERIEVSTAALLPPDLVMARALASLSDLFSYIWPWAEKHAGLQLLFPKGHQAVKEIEAALAAGWAFEYSETPSKSEPSAQILFITKLAKHI